MILSKYKRKLRPMASGWSLRWKKKLRIKQIKFLFIAHCCPFTFIYPFSLYSNGEKMKKKFIECWEKIHTPCHSHNREREESTRACDASIFYFSSHSGDGFFFPLSLCCCLFFISIHPRILFHLFFFSFCCRDINWRKSYLWKCLLSYYFFFISFSRVQNYCFRFEEGWRWSCCQIAIKSKHLFQRASTWKMDSR